MIDDLMVVYCTAIGDGIIQPVSQSPRLRHQGECTKREVESVKTISIKSRPVPSERGGTNQADQHPSITSIYTESQHPKSINMFASTKFLIFLLAAELAVAGVAPLSPPLAPPSRSHP